MADAVHPGQAADAATANPAEQQTQRHVHNPAGFQRALMRASQGTAASDRLKGAVHQAVAREPQEEAPTARQGHGAVHQAVARIPHQEAPAAITGHGAVHRAAARAPHGEASRATKSYGAVHQAVARVPNPLPIKPSATPPDASIDALSQAMTLEGVPTSWQPGLTFIMAQESGGEVGVHSPIHSARGLYQLTAPNYHYNPRGAASFGNAVEEAQGGIRYIRARYGTADNAVAFWNQHRWY